jgi:hypothetical protein
VRVSGSASGVPGVGLTTTYTCRPDEPWIMAETVFTNSGTAPLAAWVGDAIDHGAGQRSGVAGHNTITTPDAEPNLYEPTGPWIGMTGTDPQTYELIYGDSDFGAYGNGKLDHEPRSGRDPRRRRVHARSPDRRRAQWWRG